MLSDSKFSMIAVLAVNAQRSILGMRLPLYPVPTKALVPVETANSPAMAAPLKFESCVHVFVDGSYL